MKRSLRSEQFLNHQTDADVVLDFARKQNGVVSRRQLIEAGFPETLVDQRVRDHKLLPVFTGVYGLGHDVLARRGWWWAALLSAGPGAVLSHTSAAACWGLIEPRIRTEVVRRYNRDREAGGSAVPNRKLLTIHRSRHLTGKDLAHHEGFPVTSVARTILDLSATFSLSQVESLISDAEEMRTLDWKELVDITNRGSGWRGIRQLRSLVEAWDPTVADSKSPLERQFLSFCRQNSVPAPKVNVMVQGFEVDCFWPRERLVVELDSRKHHANLKRLDSDRKRDVILKNAGYDARRVTHRQLVAQPDYVLHQVLAPLHH